VFHEELEQRQRGAEAVLLLDDLDTVKLVFLGALIVGVALAARETNVLPRWLATASLIFAPVLVFSAPAVAARAS